MGCLFGEGPLLASDISLGPWPDPADTSVRQTGAWVLSDERPLSREVETFLAAGGPPLYFGLGSLRAPDEHIARTMIESARTLGRRAILSRGWAELALVDAGADCLSIGDENHELLFRHAAAVVHHGGAGTTTAAARAGAPQVVIPQMFDQHDWAARVEHLRVGVAHAPGAATPESLTRALERALQPDIVATARDMASVSRRDGATTAARLRLN